MIFFIGFVGLKYKEYEKNVSRWFRNYKRGTKLEHDS